MGEKHFVFLKNNRVELIAVFASQDEELADNLAHEQGYDDALWIGEDPVPHLHSLYDPATKTFTEPDLDYLNSLGFHTETNEQYEARIKQQYKEDAERLAQETK